MSINYDDFLKDIVSSDENIKKEMDLLELKYSIIDELVSFRKEKRLTQTEFADIIGVKQQMISRFEKGEVDPRLSFVSKVLMGMNKEIIIEDRNFKKTSEVIKFEKKAKAKQPISFKLNKNRDFANCI
ncbi:Helix-turn-helix [Peptoclostridium litorale DSM 5388]|uniref:HTH cro/C1-type domain-containing protein n=1 Tax=Peptoclostridium litorale DSM 5388 TaxID=1121324 RepID=A0A069RIF9_PEPLI|nr:helix-turn-helix transcriptional regulator [Peptoclostridium litorale]KDR96806.1 hypothetical protein CLIT_20p00190 [Peptoclostridium litorale DSM 5388]SIO36369.1 Helix-turn-helix [Peptoclostridium litorale DSM 5388]